MNKSFNEDKQIIKNKEDDNIHNNSHHEQEDHHNENKNKLISGIDIVEYKIYNARAKDLFSKKNLQDRTIHMVLKVKVRPIILKSLLENIFVFTIQEDVALNSMIVDER